ncbi:MAG TPA: hypothetical protein DEB24_01380 [Coriobacteriia bacterium]|nr:hypothetical protein [Coriobacteriia bacterium]
MKTLLGMDWREKWIRYNRARKAPDDAGFWDGRAKSFNHYAGMSAYAESFIDLLDADPGSSFLDMGCGSGTLAIPLARAGHRVVAADFSQGMLAELERSIAAEGLDAVTTVRLDFNAPWSEWLAAGLEEKSVDMALASRSTMVDDLGSAFEKLERVARKKVAVTMATEYGPRGNKHLGEPIEGVDGEITFVPDYIFAMNILFQMERFPELHFINADKVDGEGVVRKIRWAHISWRPAVS